MTGNKGVYTTSLRQKGQTPQTISPSITFWLQKWYHTCRGGEGETQQRVYHCIKMYSGFYWHTFHMFTSARRHTQYCTSLKDLAQNLTQNYQTKLKCRVATSEYTYEGLLTLYTRLDKSYTIFLQHDILKSSYSIFFVCFFESLAVKPCCTPKWRNTVQDYENKFSLHTTIES